MAFPTVHSGPVRVVAAGQVTSFRGHPLVITSGRTTLEFRFHDDPSHDGPWARLDDASTPGRTVVHCVNFDTAEGRGSQSPLALPGDPERWLHFRVFRFGQTVDRTVHYTLYEADPAPPGR